ncbi:hypothetical protein AB0D15_13220, partial [Streptomyces sp. NPDC048551]
MRGATAWGVRAAAGLLTLVGLGHTLWTGVYEPGAALAFGALIAVGELARSDHRRGAAGTPGRSAPRAARGPRRLSRRRRRARSRRAR